MKASWYKKMIHKTDIAISPPYSWYTQHRIENKRTLVFHFLFYIKHIKYMESKSIWGVITTCINTCMTPVGHTGLRSYGVLLCYSWTLLSFPLKCNLSYWRKTIHWVPLFLVLGTYILNGDYARVSEPPPPWKSQVALGFLRISGTHPLSGQITSRWRFMRPSVK